MYEEYKGLDMAFDDLHAKYIKLQLDFDAYKETASETSQCYINCHQDSWTLEQALRRIANKSFDDYDNLGESNAEEQKQVAIEALEVVWKRREERSEKIGVIE